ncbi:HAD family hydrolase [Parafrigoribacterium mesophilum]|uniref:HAD family hydrolase n=1 Tax=Parafrigoribacterium mesophilum TaxID=433646 RepID=UPI0031FDC025
MSTLSAVLFDIDGTLVDSNYSHIAAWSKALAQLGEPVDSWRIHRAIGMDSAKLLDALLHEHAVELGDRAKELHQQYFLDAASQLRAFAGARDLIQTLSARGLRIVLATSAPEKELDVLTQVLQVQDAVAEVTSASDVEAAKPEPDIIEAALAKARTPASAAIMVGDAVWDIEAAARAGVPCVAVCSGGTGALELREAGAVAVYDDVADLLAHLDAGPLAATD